jgi:threonine synthase
VVTVTDEDIARAMLMLLERIKLVSEAAGAVGSAALLTRAVTVETLVVASTGASSQVGTRQCLHGTHVDTATEPLGAKPAACASSGSAVGVVRFGSEGFHEAGAARGAFRCWPMG